MEAVWEVIKKDTELHGKLRLCLFKEKESPEKISEDAFLWIH